MFFQNGVIYRYDKKINLIKKFNNTKDICIENDLYTLNPILAQEWDYERNGGLTPDLVVPGHNTKVWWKCSTCGQSSQAPPCRRALQDSGCRKCADKNNWTIRRVKAARKECDKGQLFFDI